MKTARPSLARAMWAIGTVFVLAFIASSGYDAWRLHQEVEASHKRELSNLAKALSAQTGRGIQSVDLLLTDIALWYRMRGRELAAAEIEAELASRAGLLPTVSLLTIVDAQGRQRYRSRATTEPLSDVADRPYFRAQRERPDAGLFINAPVVTRSEGRESLVFSRRLQDKEGRFAGVVTAVITIDVLRRAYEAIDLGKRGALVMMLNDGTVVVRFPPDPAFRRADWTGQKDKPVDVLTSPADGREKLVAVVGVAQWPLMVAVSRDREELLAPVHAEVRSLAMRLAALVVFALLTMAWLARQLRRRQAAETGLRESEARYALAMDAANEGHAEWNLAEGRRFASAKWRAQHELDADADPGPLERLADTVKPHPDDAGALRKAVEDHVAGRAAEVAVEYRIRRADQPEDSTGAWRWISMRGRCVCDAGGRPLRFSCATSDITARKFAEAERALLEAQLARARHLEALGTLAGGIAHDFNNILGAILGHGELAQADAPAGSPLRRHLDRVMQAGLRARLLVRRILDFSGAGGRAKQLVPVQDAVDQALQLLASTVPESIRLVDERLQGDTAAVRGDPTQIHQLVSNLCTNAIAAMPQGGDLVVSVSRGALAEPVTLSHGRMGAGAFVRISVCDTGTGITPEVYARMFDPFFTTKSVGEGTGLGLSVVHSVIQDLQGALDVETVVGKGSRFTVWLPVAGEVHAAASARRDVLPRGRGQVVMVVDDEPALVEFAEDLLADLGYEPVGFSSGAAALQALRDDPGRFDALLTDEAMPGLTGVELVREAARIRPGLRMVVMSGYGGEQLAARVAASGAAELWSKPLAGREVAEGLARLLGRAVEADSAAGASTWGATE